MSIGKHDSAMRLHTLVLTPAMRLHDLSFTSFEGFEARQALSGSYERRPLPPRFTCLSALVSRFVRFAAPKK